MDHHHACLPPFTFLMLIQNKSLTEIKHLHPDKRHLESTVGGGGGTQRGLSPGGGRGELGGDGSSHLDRHPFPC